MPDSGHTKTAINPAIIALYDEYTHAPLPRRVFMKRLSALTGSTVAASAVLPMLENNYAQAAMLPADDPRVVTRKVSFPGPGGNFSGYLAQPAKPAGKLPAVLVIHENRGLNAHIEDIARRVALGGYLALAVDYLSAKGGTPADEDKAREMIGTLDPDTISAISLAAVAWLEKAEGANGKVGAVGFCWGGAAVNQLAVRAPGLDAAVVFYGMPPKPEDVARIKAPLLLNHAGLDERINAALPAYEAALKADGKTYELHMYPGANHAFNNDTNAARYDAAAAKLAWQRTMDFFKHTLG